MLMGMVKMRATSGNARIKGRQLRLELTRKRPERKTIDQSHFVSDEGIEQISASWKQKKDLGARNTEGMLLAFQRVLHKRYPEELSGNKVHIK